ISVDVPEIFMQQFWYTIKKVQDTDSYKFLLDNKKCTVNAKVFNTILDICPRVKGEDFTDVSDDETALTFLIDLGYKDVAFQIDHKKERKSRRENMPFPRFTKVIINHFLSQHKSLSNLKYQHYHTIKDDGIVSGLKFVRIKEDCHEYGLPIPNMMLNDSRGKGSQGKKTGNTHMADFDVSEEFDSEPTRKRTAGKRVVKKNVTISAANNIIPDPDVTLELGKSISLTEATEKEA
nr:hypothetical protein [Tanacetum cinerariifolium]